MRNSRSSDITKMGNNSIIDALEKEIPAIFDSPSVTDETIIVSDIALLFPLCNQRGGSARKFWNLMQSHF